jgi:hypothetical protein
MTYSTLRGWFIGGVCCLAACASDSKPESIFTEKAECEGESIVPFNGKHTMVFSDLRIGTKKEAFDLDGDDEPDNKLSAVSTLAGDAIDDALEDATLILPMEFFDLDELADEGGDCNDLLSSVGPDQPEVPGNGIDDDCDGMADEDAENAPSTDTSDADGDGVSLAQGDCDDTNPAIKPGLEDVCGDGLDNNCDGVADWTVNSDSSHCSPFDDELDAIRIDNNSFNTDGSPQIAFDAAEVVKEDGKLMLKAGPSIFKVVLPLIEDIDLILQITGTTIEAEVYEMPNGLAIRDGRLGGVLDAFSTDQVRGLDIEEIGLKEEDSMADALYANVLGVLLGLRKAPDGPGAGCLMPDIDVDGDGLEAFCDTTPDVEPLTIDMCVVGDRDAMHSGP